MKFLLRLALIPLLVAAAIVLAVIGAFTGHHTVGHWLAAGIILLGVAGLATLLG